MEQLDTIDIEYVKIEQPELNIPSTEISELQDGEKISVDFAKENHEEVTEESVTEVVQESFTVPIDRSVSEPQNESSKEEASQVGNDQEAEQEMTVKVESVNNVNKELAQDSLSTEVNSENCETDSIPNESAKPDDKADSALATDENTEVTNEPKTVPTDTDQSTESGREENVCTVIDIDASEESNAQCQVLLKSFSQDFENKDHSIRVDDTDLTKLVDNNSEVVLLTVETVPITESDNVTEENIVVTVHEKDITVGDNSCLSAQGKDGKKTDLVNEEYDLIDYSQESGGTIIEVISTEVVHSEIPQAYAKEDEKKAANSIVDSVSCMKNIELNNASTIVNEKSVRTQEHAKDTKQSGVNEEQPKINVNAKTDTCDNSDKNKTKNDAVHSKVVVTPVHLENSKTSNISVSEGNDSPETTAKKRSVIQDIFDDWRDENAEEDGQPAVNKIPDTVEIELKSLLDDTKSGQTITEETVLLVKEEVAGMEKAPLTEALCRPIKLTDAVNERKEVTVPGEKISNQSTKKATSQNAATPVNKDQVSISPSFLKSAKSATQDAMPQNEASQPHLTPAVNRKRNLTSQIVTPMEVTEALKEKLREKQKLVEPPPGPDIFFVKKITQRLSSKLAASPVASLPGLIPIPHQVPSSASNCEKKAVENVETKDGNSDNKELLAILEGDVDPDWSNLKPPTLTEEGRTQVKDTCADNMEDSSPPKLDPLVERELALKQLLELPVAVSKKNNSRKKKAVKQAANKSPKEQETRKEEKKDVKLEAENKVAASGDASVKAVASLEEKEQESAQEKERQEKEGDSLVADVRIDESRSGRKRKPTEKAREHEQNTTKRQKIYKSKVSVAKKQSQETETVTEPAAVPAPAPAASSETEQTLPITAVNTEVNTTVEKEVASKQLSSKVDGVMSKHSPLKRPKQNLSKKGSQQIAKRKMVVKKLMRQNLPGNKKSVNLKAKLSGSAKKSGSKIVSKAQKRAAETSSGEAKPKKKIINEIDRLLQDEGVVNLLYDVEQPDKKRLVPITKSQAKVMDIQKVQRELKIRKKLVRNAVLRLRTSTSNVTKVSPRSKRASVHVNDMPAEKKIPEQVPPAVKTADGTDFIFPAKIRNAADASVIIRRHSSSSFSSASGSPRVSIDGPEKSESVKSEEGSHSLRSTKRRHSQDERMSAKKSKKKPVQKLETESMLGGAIEDKMSVVRVNKKSELRKAEKGVRQTETVAGDDSNSSSGKVVTRSNGTTTGKITTKNKKQHARNKVTFAKTCEPDNTEESSKGEDELSACLAEAATALSVVNTGSRSGNASSTSRKNKVHTNITKILDAENSKVKLEVRSQFTNKEINVRRHGNLVQLILTPSSCTKLRNALTLQMMQEFREALSILRKDDDCRVVLLTSTGTSFCEGLELSVLLHPNKEERRLRAQELADGVKDFIKCLASFNKPIVAGVQGAAVGLGVTMLPLFDLVIASDKATFSTPYGKLGQIAEGAAIFTLSHILGSAITSELLLGGRTLTASEALRAGLVTRVLWPDRFQVELLPTLRPMSEQSSQSMEATKALLRHSLRKKLDAALESETYLLVQHWCSAECQTAIKAYIDGKVQ